jgi:L-2-hydroxyglutarate oxidase LhgO
MTLHVDYDLIVIGGGIVGLATAYKIATKHPHLKIAVVEKESTLATHQTGHNSGVIHSGLYYRPGSAKAETCAKGRRELVEFAKAHDIKHEICGKVIVATDERELPHMDRIFEYGQKNGVEGIEKISAERIRELEPACTGIAGLHVPCTGIIDFTQVANKLAELITVQNEHNNILMEHEVTGFDRHDFYTKIVTSKWPFSISTRFVISCAGLQSDRIARLDGVDAGMRIVPFRGDYFELRDTAAEKVKNLIYPVPDPRFPFLGIHFTRTIDGSVECGPNAVFAFKREGYSKTAFNVKDTLQSLQFPGTWKLFFKNWK